MVDNDCSVSCGNNVVESPELCDGNCLSTCADDGESCTKEVLTGSAAQCNVACTHTKIANAANGDRCCPTGANAKTDSDCLSVCGNGVVESGELCDGNCANSCPDDNMACTTDALTGSASQCNAECEHTPITRAVNGDNCCPPGMSSTADSDCSRYKPASGAVLDTTTGLTWQQNAASARQQPEAASYCAALSLAGSRWRLPTRDELHTLMDTSKGDIPIDQATFPDSFSGANDGFWSSTPVDGKPDWGWDVYFVNGGGDSSDPFTTPFQVRCVH